MRRFRAVALWGACALLIATAAYASGIRLPGGPYVVGGGAGPVPGEHMNGYANIDGGGMTGQMQALAAGQPPPAPLYHLHYNEATGDYLVFLNGVYMGEVRVMAGPFGSPPTYQVDYYASNGAYAGSGTWTG